MSLSQREQRTVRIAAIGVVLYLCLFYGARGVQRLEAKRDEYQLLLQEAAELKEELRPYENKILLLEKLRSVHNLDPARLDAESLTAEVSAAIQEAAKASGVKLGPIRESSGRSSGRELTSMRFEGTGQVEALVQALYRLKTLGFPVIVDSVQIDRDERKPGELKLSLSVVVLDFTRWNPQEDPNV